MTERKMKKVRTDAPRKKEKETSRKTLFVWKRRESDKGANKGREEKLEEKEKEKEDE